MRSKAKNALKRIKIRQDWSKYNLYNLSRLKDPNFITRTYYQQKWTAKSTTRAYHGEHIREKQWQRMFKPRLRAVIPMDHKYLAQYDGSELAAGRGSGRDPTPDQDGRSNKMGGGRTNHIPYMSMTFAPLERRLDTAIFRAMFASSSRQARQFVTHGKVKVNGKKMPYPGYLLNPGDMFQVDPEGVMFATGARKESHQIRAGRRALAMKRGRARVEAQRREAAQLRRKTSREANAAQGTSAVTTREEKIEDLDESEGKNDAQRRRIQRKQLNQLRERADFFLNDKKMEPSARRKQEFRAFKKSIKNSINKINKTPVDDVEKQLASLLAEIKLLTPKSKQSSYGQVLGPASPRESPKSATVKDRKPRTSAAAASTQTQEAILEQQLRLLQEERENPVDESKPYATPWQPRPYMSAFAFIPRYLEVNHKICSAVYLRHPVARPGIAEVPSPFGAQTQQLAFNWYLRRGR